MENGLTPGAAFDASFDDDGDWLAKMAAMRARNQQWAKPGDWSTKLPADQETSFRDWVSKNKVPFNPNDPVADYDMRGFWSALQGKDPRATTAVDPNDKLMHYPDAWKTPYHETFSRESVYATPTAPYWLENRYLVTPEGKVLFDDEKQGDQ